MLLVGKDALLPYIQKFILLVLFSTWTIFKKSERKQEEREIKFYWVVERGFGYVSLFCYKSKSSSLWEWAALIFTRAFLEYKTNRDTELNLELWLLGNYKPIHKIMTLYWHRQAFCISWQKWYLDRILEVVLKYDKFQAS